MKKCFVIMPFSRTSQKHSAEYWERFFRDFLTPALRRCRYAAYKSEGTPHNITKEIIESLSTADLVLAVLTDTRHNVMYELGIRHSLRLGTIMIIEEGQPLPFDLSNYGVLFYSDRRRDGFATELKRQIATAEKGTKDSPVTDFLRNQRIAISVHTAIARLRQSADLVRGMKSGDLHRALARIRKLQKTWIPGVEQVSVVDQAGRVVLHADGDFPTLTADECWKDVILGGRTLYELMKQRNWGFRIAQLKEFQDAGRLTAIAWETIPSPTCMIVAEAHYFQEDRPY